MYRRHRNLPVTCVRALNAYGPGQSVAAPYGPSKVRKIMPSFVMRALSGDPIQIYGDGQQIMDMVYVDDVADIMVRALRHTEACGGYDGVIDAGTGRRTTVEDIAKAVIAEVGAGHIEHLPMRPGETPGAVVVADTTTLDVLGVDPSSLVRLEDGLVPTVAYFQQYAAART
jgi:UDP-glucose 4-epimerase